MTFDNRPLGRRTYLATTLEDGSSATVVIPGDAPLTFKRQFEVREDTRTVFTADFTPVKRGRTESYVLQPVPDGLRVSYEGNNTDR